jgi:hypothetical protein
MTEKSEQGGAGDLTGWCLQELEAMLAEQVRLLKADAPVTPGDRPAHIRSIKELAMTARCLATAKAAMARAAWSLERTAGDRAARQARHMGRAAPSGPAKQGEPHRADDHNLEQRQAAINARFAAMAPGPHCGGAGRNGASGDVRAGGLLSVAGA